MASPSRSDNLGFDLFVGPQPGGVVDMTPSARAATGIELVQNKLIALSMADTIDMVGAPGGKVDFGEDVRRWVGSPTTPSIIAQRQQRLSVVYARERRINPSTLAVAIATQLVGARYSFTIRVTARTWPPASLPIDLLLGVNALTVDFLAQRGQQQ